MTYAQAFAALADPTFDMDASFARFLAMFGPILASSLIAFFGGYGPAATTLASIFAIGIIAVLFLPETKGRPLPA